MVKDEQEVSVFFNVSKDLLKEFQNAVKIKSKALGIPLNKRQAYSLALKEISEKWTTENPAE